MPGLFVAESWTQYSMHAKQALWQMSYNHQPWSCFQDSQCHSIGDSKKPSLQIDQCLVASTLTGLGFTATVCPANPPWKAARADSFLSQSESMVLAFQKPPEWSPVVLSLFGRGRYNPQVSFGWIICVGWSKESRYGILICSCGCIFPPCWLFQHWVDDAWDGLNRR